MDEEGSKGSGNRRVGGWRGEEEGREKGKITEREKGRERGKAVREGSGERKRDIFACLEASQACFPLSSYTPLS